MCETINKQDMKICDIIIMKLVPTHRHACMLRWFDGREIVVHDLSWNRLTYIFFSCSWPGRKVLVISLCVSSHLWIAANPDNNFRLSLVRGEKVSPKIYTILLTKNLGYQTCLKPFNKPIKFMFYFWIPIWNLQHFSYVVIKFFFYRTRHIRTDFDHR